MSEKIEVIKKASEEVMAMPDWVEKALGGRTGDEAQVFCEGMILAMEMEANNLSAQGLASPGKLRQLRELKAYHGSHNQKDHTPGKGGGGALPAGANGVPAKMPITTENLSRLQSGESLRISGPKGDVRITAKGDLPVGKGLGVKNPNAPRSYVARNLATGKVLISSSPANTLSNAADLSGLIKASEEPETYHESHNQKSHAPGKGGNAIQQSGGAAGVQMAKDSRGQQFQRVGPPIGASRVRVNTNDFEFSHGKQPSGEGSWAFAFGSKNGQIRMLSGKYGAVKAQAQAEAGLLGHRDVFTLG